MFMALRYIDSCGDHYDTAHILSKWDAQNPTGGAIAVTTGRTGNGLVITPAASANGLVHNLAFAEIGLVAGVAFKLNQLPTSNTPLFGFGDNGTYQTTVCVDVGGRMYVTTGGTTTDPFLNPAGLTPVTGATSPGGALITNNQWYYVEMKTTFSTAPAGSCVVRLGETQLFSVSGVKTASSPNSSANQFILMGSQSFAGGNVNYFDDIYLANLTGGTVSNFLGDRKVGVLVPSADYSVSLTPSSGSAHYMLVNDSVPDEDVSYNSSATPGQFDLYELADLPGSVSTVNGLQSVMYARKDDGSARIISPRFSDGSTSTNGATISVPSSYGYRLETFDSSPVDGSALTVAKVNALKAGITIIS